MKKPLPLLTLTIIAALSTACDIQPVGAGVWDITIDAPQGSQTSIWTIGADDTISMAGESVAQADEVRLNGSRITWSMQTSEAIDASNAVQRTNFIGTVNGDSLAGTVFTTQGNFSVKGTRQ